LKFAFVVEFDAESLASAAILQRQINGVCEPVLPAGYNDILTAGSVLELLESYWAVACHCRNVASRLTDADCDLCKRVKPILEAAGVVHTTKT